MSIISLVPHRVSVLGDGGVKLAEFAGSEDPARIYVSVEGAGLLYGRIPLKRAYFGEVKGLPEQREDQWFIVSQLVKNAAYWREDLLVPSDLVRDGSGVVIGCRSFNV